MQSATDTTTTKPGLYPVKSETLQLPAGFAPVFKTTPLPKQLELIQTAILRRENAFLCSCGSGKTKMAIDTLANKYILGAITTAVVIVPEGLQKQWREKELPLHCPVEYASFTWSNSTSKRYQQVLSAFLDSAERGLDNKLYIFLVNVESFSASNKTFDVVNRMCTKTKCALVLDEATRIKNPSAKRTKKLMALSPKAAATIIMTGTPGTNGVLGFYSMFNFLKPRYFPQTYTAFRCRYALTYRQHVKRGGVVNTVLADITPDLWRRIKADLKRLKVDGKVNQVGIDTLAACYNTTASVIRTINNQKNFSRAANVEELTAKIAPVTLRASIHDMAKMPDKVYDLISLPLSPEKRKLLKTLQSTGIAWYEKEVLEKNKFQGDEKLIVRSKIALAARVLQICGGLAPVTLTAEGLTDFRILQDENRKLQYIIDDLDELADTPAVVWCAYKKEAEMVQAALSRHVPAACYTGDFTKEERARQEAYFIAGKVQILVCTVDSAAFGHNWPHARTQYWYSRTWSQEKRLQAEDRSYRQGIREAVQYKDLVYGGTLDERIYTALKSGIDVNDYILKSDVREILRVDV